MMAAVAAVLMAVGSARAVDRVDGAAAPAGRKNADDVAIDRESRPAVTKMKPTDATDRSGYITREEFMKYYGAVLDRIARDEKARQPPEPTFTDAG
jgi:hypothetical protein